jgi:hypothetical protein
VLTAAELHGDFWGHVHAFINEGDTACSKMFMVGNLVEFERVWLDPRNGRIATLESETWFADARPSAKRFAYIAIQDYLRNSVDYYSDAEKILSDDTD